MVKATASFIRKFPLLGLLLLVFVLSSCSTKVRFSTSSVVPAAEGYVKVKKDENKNYLVELRINNLASPERLDPAREVYVVWMDSGKDITRNLGQLKSSSGWFSSGLEGSLTATTPYEPSRIFITAEDKVTVESPGRYVVLSTKKF